MKSSSNIAPKTIEHLGNGKWHYNYNVVQTEVDGESRYDYDQVILKGKPTYESTVAAIVRDRYTVDAEIAIQRKGIADNSNQEFVGYNSFVEGIKAMVKEDIAL
jgi:hypothetical protein